MVKIKVRKIKPKNKGGRPAKSKPPREELQLVYAFKKSIVLTAKRYNVSSETVRKWLISYDIPRYPPLVNHRSEHQHLSRILNRKKKLY